MTDEWVSKGRNQGIKRRVSAQPSKASQRNEDWSEWSRMLSSGIHWKGNIPNSFEQCQKENKPLFEIIQNTKTNPTKIRNEQAFIYALNKQIYKKHKSYIDANLDRRNPPPPPPGPPPSTNSHHGRANNSSTQSRRPNANNNNNQFTAQRHRGQEVMHVNHHQRQPVTVQRGMGGGYGQQSHVRNRQISIADDKPLINKERRNEQNFQQKHKGCSVCIIL